MTPLEEDHYLRGYDDGYARGDSDDARRAPSASGHMCHEAESLRAGTYSIRSVDGSALAPLPVYGRLIVAYLLALLAVASVAAIAGLASLAK